MNTEKMYKLLIVEDDVNLGIVIEDYLASAGFETHLAKNGQEARSLLNEQSFDLILLDIMLPDTDGYTFAREIRKRNQWYPIIFLTAKNMVEDRIKGLEIGADDYITKPFEPEELRLRILAVLKRYKMGAPSPAKLKRYCRLGNYRFYPEQLLLKYDEAEVELTSTEAALLSLLHENKNSVVTREMAFQRVWGMPDDPNSRNYDVYIGKLRKLLAQDSAIVIKSVHKKGYRLETNA